MIEWDNTMSVGIWKMDQQHKRWVEIINTLSECIAQNRSCECIKEALSHTYDYTQTHFSDEENLLLKNHYPDLHAHREEHTNFIMKLDNLKQPLQSHEFGMALDLMGELCNWLIHHIKGCDKQYGQALAVTSSPIG